MKSIAVQYPVVLHRAADREAGFGVSVPDLPGCISVGGNFGEALRSIREAIEFHVEGMLSDGEKVPEPAPVDEHLGDEAYETGIWALVEVELPVGTFSPTSRAA
ncbi:MAG: type II toxin-antitoxin system HicB family antitoxin [Verrucomicrobiae bacterium]|nr:type II toxin-antitoxin system HicB family antitoxin [Verrucomicrobiae bacterium]MCP5542189.1 type II toxin-antitoxin system HicB family antitoxin [Akkermansiaceae bacterium]MCP5551528.1 type II toxin-antitoxin system HicB family antitoxin [Akkermansiaceae bacterium]